ncbi:MAG: MFS transporter [Anaerolineales bacterium]|nr:MFS transporter [Anaerolineales bacterium]
MMSVSTPAGNLSPFAIFRNRSFTRMWLAQLVSTIGDAFTMIAAGIYVFRLTNSTLQVGLMLMATAVPTMVIGMIAGVFVDRYDRKKIMIWADILRGCLILLIPILLPYHVAWLYIIVMLTSSIGTFFAPAFDSVLPELATDEELTAANSMIAISSFGSTAIGFAASGLIAAYSIEWAFYLDGASFFLSALLLASVKIAVVENPEKTTITAVMRNLREGLTFLFGNRVLRSVVLVGFMYAFSIGIWNTMLLPFATLALGASEFEYGLQEGVTSIGFVLGSLLIARFSGRLREGQWISLSLLGMGGFGIVYALSSSIPLAILLVTITGVMNAPYSVARRTLIQRNTDREMRGRVFGAMMTLGTVVMLLGMGAAGLADYIGVREMMLTSVILTALGGVYALFAPGLGQPAAEWLRAVSLLRNAASAPTPEAGRPATLADFDRLIGHLPSLSILDASTREKLLKDARYLQADEGCIIVRHGEVSDAAYFIVDGKAIAGRTEGQQEKVLEVLNAGDFFGEIAALTGIPRTANIIVEKPTDLLRVPASTLRELSSQPDLNRIFMTKMTERMVSMNMIEMPKMMALDQNVLRELRTDAPAAMQPA